MLSSQTCIHSEQPVVAEELAGELLELAKDVVVEGPRGEGQGVCLRLEGSDDPSNQYP